MRCCAIELRKHTQATGTENLEFMPQVTDATAIEYESSQTNRLPAIRMNPGASAKAEARAYESA